MRAATLPLLPALALLCLAAAPSRAAEADLRDSVALEARNRELEAVVRALREEWTARRLEEALAHARALRHVVGACLLGPVDEVFLVQPGSLVVDVSGLSEEELTGLRRRLSFLPPPGVDKRILLNGIGEAQLQQTLEEFAMALKEAAELMVFADPRVRTLADWGYAARLRWPSSTFVVRALEWKDFQAVMDRLRDAPGK